MSHKSICKILLGWGFFIGYVLFIIQTIKLLPDIHDYTVPDMMILAAALLGPFFLWYLCYWLYEKCQNKSRIDTGYREIREDDKIIIANI